MYDNYKRKIDYLRISVTDKCNLRCVYCMPSEGVPLMQHDDILTLEEILRICEAAAKLGVEKIRITGGEPLVRKGIISLIRRIKRIQGIKQVTLTTNGILLSEYVKELKEAGIDGINISLDSLDGSVYSEITGTAASSKVIDGLRAAVEAGIKVKINCVPVRELNISQIVPIAAFAKDYAIDVRFIELMPIGFGKKFHAVPNEEILTILKENYGPIHISHEVRGNGPAQYYSVHGFQGGIGFISAVTHRFCSECNRIRLTCDGMLKLCLHYNQGISLKEPLRNHISDDVLQSMIREAVFYKPEAHNFGGIQEEIWENKRMNQIGG